MLLYAEYYGRKYSPSYTDFVADSLEEYAGKYIKKPCWQRWLWGNIFRVRN
jgi:hypothetical protein